MNKIITQVGQHAEVSLSNTSNLSLPIMCVICKSFGIKSPDKRLSVNPHSLSSDA